MYEKYSLVFRFNSIFFDWLWLDFFPISVALVASDGRFVFPPLHRQPIQICIHTHTHKAGKKIEFASLVIWPAKTTLSNMNNEC